MDTAHLSPADLLAALRQGDEDAFRALVISLHPALVRMAGLYVTAAVAEEVVQDTWVAVVEHLDGFEGPSTLRTWIFRIMLNTVRTRAERDARVVPFAAQGPASAGTGPVVDPDRLVHPDLGGAYWPAAPSRWDSLPEERLMGAEVRRVHRRRAAGAARGAAGGRGAARRRGVEPRRGVRSAWDIVGQPAGTAAPGPQRHPHRAGGVPP